MDDGHPTKSLLEYFVEGKKCLQKLEDLAGRDPEYDPTLRRGIDSLRTAMQQINKVGLFSANEEAEDIKTSSLKCV
jgi:hypothetical protein